MSFDRIVAHLRGVLPELENPRALLLLAWIVFDSLKERGHCFAKQSTLGRRIKRTERTVRSLCEVLSALDAIYVTDQKGPNRIDVNYERLRIVAGENFRSPEEGRREPENSTASVQYSSVDFRSHFRSGFRSLLRSREEQEGNSSSPSRASRGREKTDQQQQTDHAPLEVTRAGVREESPFEPLETAEPERATSAVQTADTLLQRAHDGAESALNGQIASTPASIGGAPSAGAETPSRESSPSQPAARVPPAAAAFKSSGSIKSALERASSRLSAAPTLQHASRPPATGEGRRAHATTSTPDLEQRLVGLRGRASDVGDVMHAFARLALTDDQVGSVVRELERAVASPRGLANPGGLATVVGQRLRDARTQRDDELTAAREHDDPLDEAPSAPAPDPRRAALRRRCSELRGMLENERSTSARARHETELAAARAELAAHDAAHPPPPRAAAAPTRGGDPSACRDVVASMLPPAPRAPSASAETRPCGRSRAPLPEKPADRDRIRYDGGDPRAYFKRVADDEADDA